MTEVSPIRPREEATLLENGDELLFNAGNKDHIPEWIILAAREAREASESQPTDIVELKRPLSPEAQASVVIFGRGTSLRAIRSYESTESEGLKAAA